MQHVTVYAGANYYLEFRRVTLHCTFNHRADLFKMTHAAMRRYLLSLVVHACLRADVRVRGAMEPTSSVVKV